MIEDKKTPNSIHRHMSDAFASTVHMAIRWLGSMHRSVVVSAMLGAGYNNTGAGHCLSRGRILCIRNNPGHVARICHCQKEIL